jgi:hypothetical protein
VSLPAPQPQHALPGACALRRGDRVSVRVGTGRIRGTFVKGGPVVLDDELYVTVVGERGPVKLANINPPTPRKAEGIRWREGDE